MCVARWRRMRNIHTLHSFHVVRPNLKARQLFWKFLSNIGSKRDLTLLDISICFVSHHSWHAMLAVFLALCVYIHTHIFRKDPYTDNFTWVATNVIWFANTVLIKSFSPLHLCSILMTVKSNDSPGVSTYQSITCLLNNLFRLTTRKHQRSATPSLCVGIIRSPLNSTHKRTVTWKMFLFDDIIMFCCEILQALSQCALYRRINDSPKTNYMSNCWHYLRANDVKCRDVRSGN